MKAISTRFDIASEAGSHITAGSWGGKPWTPNQEDAWNLLNEIDQLIKILEQLARSLPPENDSELAQQVRHKLVMHQPAWKDPCQAMRPKN